MFAEDQKGVLCHIVYAVESVSSTQHVMNAILLFCLLRKLLVLQFFACHLTNIFKYWCCHEQGNQKYNDKQACVYIWQYNNITFYFMNIGQGLLHQLPVLENLECTLLRSVTCNILCNFLLWIVIFFLKKLYNSTLIGVIVSKYKQKHLKDFDIFCLQNISNVEF